MTVKLEHANFHVRDLDAAIRFLTAAFPEFRIRGEGWKTPTERWVHIGTDTTYLALSEAWRPAAEAWVPYAGKPGLNHLGFEVDDVAALRERLLAAGFAESTIPNEHPHRRRVYFHDADGNDWEFVEYSSDVASERNDYLVPDIA